MTPALSNAEQDFDAGQLQRLHVKIYTHIEIRIRAGCTPAEVMAWIDGFYAWDRINIIYRMAENTAQSLYRKHELELARKALEKAGTK